MITNKIHEDTIEAQKAKDTAKLLVLRGLSSEIKNHEINVLRPEGRELNDDEIIKVLNKEARKRKESIDLFRENGRDELAKVEELELNVIKKYLPKQMSVEEIEAIVDEVLEKSPNNKEFGPIMGMVMGKVAGKADGLVVSEIVKDKLS